jgi:hypothetical protein
MSFESFAKSLAKKSKFKRLGPKVLVWEFSPRKKAAGRKPRYKDHR